MLIDKSQYNNNNNNDDDDGGGDDDDNDDDDNDNNNNNNNERISRAPFHVNMLNCAEQGQIQKYKTHAFKTLKTAGVQTIMLTHPTKQLKPPQQKQKHTNKKQTKKPPIKPKHRINVHIK